MAGCPPPDAEYVTFAGPEPRTFAGHDGLREAWAEGRANWEVFRFTVLDADEGMLEVGFRGVEQTQGIELSGVLWFRVEERDGRSPACGPRWTRASCPAPRQSILRPWARWRASWAW